MADTNLVLFAAVRPFIGSITLNCTLREEHGADYYMSTEPIEDGSYLTDHRIREPILLTMEAIISPYPDNMVDQFRGESGQAKRNALDYERSVWARIRAVADSNTPFSVYTSREHYADMTFETFRHIEQGEGVIHLYATLRQVQIATLRVDAFTDPSMANILGSSDNLGLQGTTPL